MSPAVETAGLTRRFGRRWALAGIDLQVEEGESVALLGPNGAGKTTLLRVLAGLLGSTGGDVRVLGHSLPAGGSAVRARTLYMAPGGHAYDDLTGLENLGFAARMLGQPTDRAALLERLSRVGLADSVDTRVRGYSSGMRKRLELARAGLHHPALVLLDEPFASLDDAGVAAVQAAIQGWRSRGATVLVATHRVDAAREQMERRIRLEDGRRVFPADPDAGPPREAP